MTYTINIKVDIRTYFIHLLCGFWYTPTMPFLIFEGVFTLQKRLNCILVQGFSSSSCPKFTKISLFYALDMENKTVWENVFLIMGANLPLLSSGRFQTKFYIAVASDMSLKFNFALSFNALVLFKILNISKTHDISKLKMKLPKICFLKIFQIKMTKLKHSCS